MGPPCPYSADSSCASARRPSATAPSSPTTAASTSSAPRSTWARPTSGPTKLRSSVASAAATPAVLQVVLHRGALEWAERAAIYEHFFDAAVHAAAADIEASTDHVAEARRVGRQVEHGDGGIAVVEPQRDVAVAVVHDGHEMRAPEGKAVAVHHALEYLVHDLTVVPPERDVVYFGPVGQMDHVRARSHVAHGHDGEERNAVGKIGEPAGQGEEVLRVEQERGAAGDAGHHPS